MTGYNDNTGNKMIPYKCVGALEAQVNACLTKCYEVTESIGASRVTEATTGHLDTVARGDLNVDFYKNLGFDENIWDFTKILTQGFPELK